MTFKERLRAVFKGKKPDVIPWKTPVGIITQIKEYVSQAYTWAYREYPVKTVQDLKVLRFIYEHQEIKPNYEVQKNR